MTIQTPGELEYLNTLFAAEGQKLFAVGGMVRNTLLLLPISDIDTCSAMRPDDVTALCEKYSLVCVKKGIEFGMVEIHFNGFSTEHTTFRSDTYSEGGIHKPVGIAYSDSIETDAFRRDFTINALYYDIGEKQIIDPTGGLSDIKARVMRTTNKDPDLILKDDGLRILRLVRFASELNFTIDGDTMQAAKRNVAGLADISGERIRDELFKILMSDVRYGVHGTNDESAVLFGLMKLKDMGALDVILPELVQGRGVLQKTSHHAYDVLDHALHTAASAKAALKLRVAGLLHDVGKPEALRLCGKMYGHDKISANISREILARLKCSNSLTDEVCDLILNHMYDLVGTAKESTLRMKFAKLGYERSLALADMREADVHGSGIITGRVDTAERWRSIIAAMRSEGAPFDESELDCTGDDIMRWLNIPPSPKVGEIKQRLFMHCAKRPKDNERSKLKEIARNVET